MYTILLTSGTSRKSLAVAKSLKSAGYKVVSLFHRRHPFAYSNLFDSVIQVEVDRETEHYAHAIVYAVLKKGVDLVIPLDFADVVAVSKHYEFIERFAIPAAPPLDAVVKASDKLNLGKFMSEIKIPYPKTIIVRDKENLEKSVSSLDPPIVVKGAGDASNPEYLPSHKLAIRSAENRIPCILQEFIPGSGHGYYTVSVNGYPYLEFMHRRVVELDPIGGPSMMACRYFDPVLIRLGRRIIRRLNWTGPMMVEFRKDRESGIYYVMELNPKFWGSIDLPVSLGYHFPVVLAKYYLEGSKVAREFVKELKVAERGCFAWVLDSMRYLIKDPHTWFYMLKHLAKHVRMTDIDPSDCPRVMAQLATALILMRRSIRRRFLDKWSQDRVKILWWLHEAKKRVKEKNMVLSLDLDGTLVSLDVNWRHVRNLLVRNGLINSWEGVMEGLCKAWREDRERYRKASELVEKFELEAVRRIHATKEMTEVKEMLSGLKTNVTIIYLVTKQTARVARLALEQLGLSHIFDGLITRDLVPVRGRQLKKCVEGTENVNLFHIGDTLEDIVATYQVGGLPLCKANKRYRLIQSFRLGAPASYNISHLIDFIRKIVR